MRREGSFWEDLGSSGAKVIVKRTTGESLLPNPPALAPDKTTSKNREDVEGGLGRDRAGGTKPQLAGKKPESQERGRGSRGHKAWPEMGSFSHVISSDGNKRKKRREEEN